MCVVYRKVSLLFLYCQLTILNILDICKICAFVTCLDAMGSALPSTDNCLPFLPSVCFSFNGISKKTVFFFFFKQFNSNPLPLKQERYSNLHLNNGDFNKNIINVRDVTTLEVISQCQSVSCLMPSPSFICCTVVYGSTIGISQNIQENEVRNLCSPFRNDKRI